MVSAETKPLLVVRADADGTIGSGHVMRCLALACEWKKQGGEAIFLGRINAGPLRDRIIAEGCRLQLLAFSHPDPADQAATVAWLLEHRHQQRGWVLLDGYRFDVSYHDAIRASGWSLLVIDDFAHLPEYHADILLNPNAYAEELPYSTNHDARYLFGSQFAPLRREFRLAREQNPMMIAPGRRLLVTMGGADPDNVSARVLDALLAVGDNDLTVKIVIGPLNPYRQILAERLEQMPFHAELLAPVTDMAPLMLWADLAISASGSTCWELACLGVPMVVTVLADNQERVAASLVAHGAAASLGWFHAWLPGQAADELRELLADAEKRRLMGEGGRRLVDGRGCTRIIEQMEGAQ